MCEMSLAQLVRVDILIPYLRIIILILKRFLDSECFIKMYAFFFSMYIFSVSKSVSIFSHSIP